ncbi:MAG: hypothetical protein JRI53_08715 [Deltaproteobacteria bacterium]|nr:hypothetical protein [Deltaproteobacteria bacterium]
MNFSINEKLPIYEIKAENFAAQSSNKIHNSEMAQTFGFSEGLVPGIAIYAYMAHPIAMTLGIDWLKNGTINAKFIKPVYHGETIHIHCQAVTLHPLSFEINVINSKDILCAVGNAGFSNTNPVLLPADYPDHPLPHPDDLYPARCQSILPGTRLGDISLQFDDDDPEAYFFENIQKTLPIFQNPDSILHPAVILQFANLIVIKNINVGPWIHVSSNVTNYAPVFHGSQFRMKGNVIDSYQKKGNDFLVLDLAVFNKNNDPVAHIEHRAIIRLK